MKQAAFIFIIIISAFLLQCDYFFDIERPKVIINEPKENDSLYRNVNISVSSTDNIEISKIEIYLDSILCGIFNSSPCQTQRSLDTLNKKCVIRARAYDKAGNWNETKVTFFSLKEERLPSIRLRLIGSYNTPGDCRDVEVVGNYAYIADSNAFRILNILDPVNPYEIGHLNIVGLIRNVSINNNYAYLADFLGSLKIINISNPASPQLVAQINVGVMNYGVVDVIAEGNYAYCTAYSPDALYIIDISQPNNPMIVCHSNAIGTGYTWQIAKSGQYVYALSYLGLRIFNVSVPSSLTETRWGGSIDNSYGSSFQIKVQHNTLYYSNGDLQIVNIANPTSPILECSYPVYSYLFGVAMQDSFIYLSKNDTLFLALKRSNEQPRALTCVRTLSRGYNIAVKDSYVYLCCGIDGLKIYKREVQ